MRSLFAGHFRSLHHLQLQRSMFQRNFGSLEKPGDRQKDEKKENGVTLTGFLRCKDYSLE